MLICSVNQVSLPESWQIKPGAGHSCGHCSTAVLVLSVSAGGAGQREQNLKTVKSAHQIRKLMLNASLGTVRGELEPQWSIPILVSHSEVHHLESAHRSRRALDKLKPYKLCYPLLNLTSPVFPHSELRMTHAFQRKPTLSLELCSSVIVHLPTLPLPSHTWLVTASLYVLLFWCSTSTIRFLSLERNCSVSIFTWKCNLQTGVCRRICFC